MKRSTGFYNEDIKTKFLLDETCEKASDGSLARDETGEYVISNRGRYNKIRATFNKLGEYERKYQKDFYEITLDEDEDFLSDVYLKLLSNANASYERAIYAILREYILWCRNNNIITTKQYFQHPFYEVFKYNWGWRKDSWGNGSSSVRIERQLEYVKKDFSDEDMLNNYIFPSEDEFFQYVSAVYGGTENIMIAAILCLLYYGFPKEEIRFMKRVEVIEDSRIIRRVLIDNDVAWALIYKAKWADGYNKKYTDRVAETRYADGPYLIRTNMKSSETEPVGAGFFKKLYQKEESVVSNLPASSIYKNVLVSPNDIISLRVFYKIMSDEQECGTDYVVEKFRQKKYNTALDYRKYQIMRIKALNK